MVSPELTALIERARNHKMTPQEKFAQRVSFIYGQQDYDNPHQRTKRQIAETVADIFGYPTEWVDGIGD